uniref:RNA methyltransferase n=1 Tax=Rhodosorus marinus TaxID=101924 RepID=A0A7S2ZEC0_9RHOD|mmetsp:Transcript_13859/g.55884  ORF Transcript_13859/g.55884 Transcript_13859/m.55884 type:complete len:346 (+) Transcript_13859:2724-3761(+)
MVGVGRVRKRSRGDRPWTVSVALPGSILSNAQSEILRTYVAGSVARTLAIFEVDEVVVFDDSGEDKYSDDTLELLLKYLETPQYLRRHLFPMEARLRNVGLLNPLDAPHHLREREYLRWREGVVVEQGFKRGGQGSSPWNSSRGNEEKGHRNLRESNFADVGWRDPVHISGKKEPIGTRITIDFGFCPNRPVKEGKLAGRDEPRRSGGLYWGYRVRRAGKLSTVFENCPFESGYDFVVGTSERGRSVADANLSVGPFQHLLVVFGGVKGIEHAAMVDDVLVERGIGKDISAEEIFDEYINTCPTQGSRTIRTEEAIPISLTALRPCLVLPDSAGEDEPDRKRPAT